MNSRDAIDVGIVDPKNITALQADLMMTYAAAKIGAAGDADGVILIPAGRHMQYFGGSRYYFTLNKSIRYCGVLDPEKILPSQQKGLKQLLLMASKEKGLEAGRYCVAVPIDGGDELQFYHLRSTLSVRTKHNRIDYYDVIDDSGKSRLGSGAFGSVHIVPGTIKPRYFNPNDLFFSPGNQKRVAKLQHHDRRLGGGKKPFARLTRVKREVDLLRRSNHSSVRDLNVLYGENEATSIINMHRFEGNDLREVLDYDECLRKLHHYQVKIQSMALLLEKQSGNSQYFLDDYVKALNLFNEEVKRWGSIRSKLHPNLKNGLTIKDRIELSLLLLREYQQEIQNNNILHRDLKLENVFLDIDDGDRLQPRIIDLGLSCDNSSYSQTKKSVGSLLFKSPEAVGCPNTLKSDVYALMRVIALIWRDQELFSHESSGITLRAFSKFRKEEKVVNYKLFDGLDIDKNLADMIERAIRNGTEWDANKRFGIADEISAFEAVRLQYYLDHARSEYHEEIREAHRQALSILDDMGDKDHNSTAEIADKIKKHAGFIGDRLESINIFVKTLGIRSLCHCRTVEDVSDKIDKIVSRYHDIYSAFLSRLSDLQGKAYESGIDSYQQYLEDCQGLANKYSSERVSINNMSDATHHLLEKMMKMNMADRYYQGMNTYRMKR